MEQIEIKNRFELYGGDAKYKGYNLFIEASAGAGKTETIINMIVDQLINNVSPEKIVVITFTNKATEELLKRINEIINSKLIEYKKDEVNNSSIIEILQKSLNNLYKVNVSTIHHFCNVLLNENSYKAKLSFNATLLEEPEEKNRRDLFYYKWIHNLSENNIKEISNCVIKESKNKKKSPFKELKNIYDELCNQFDDIVVKAEFNFDYDEFVDSVYNLYTCLLNYIDQAELGSYALKFIELFQNAYNSYGTQDNIIIFEECITNELLTYIRTDIKLKYNRKYILTKDEIDSINENEIKPLAIKCSKIRKIADIFKDIKDYAILNEYAVKAWNDYKDARDRVSLCNNQLIYETFKLLKENDDVKVKLAKNYDVIFVDEFQDTDKYQNKFIMDLALAIDKRKEKQNIFSTSIVLVGDPKQSIYGFRGADFKLFMETRNSFSTCGLRNAINILLPDNYRSNQYVLKWINEAYCSKIYYDGYKYNDMVIPQDNMIPTTPQTNMLAGVYSYNFNNDDKFYNYAHLIKKIKETKKIFKKDKQDNLFKPSDISYSDFLILTTSHSEINQFVIAFNKLNIKTLVSGEFDLCSSTAIGYIYRILLYILDKENNNKKLIIKDFNANIYDDNKIKEIENATKEFSSYGKLLYIFNNIDLILEDFGNSDKELLKTILAQVFENICFDNNVSSTTLLDTFDKFIHTVQEEELSLEPNEDAVRIMNVHKAKGLTAEIVIVADSGGFKTDSGCRIINDSIYLHNLSLFPNEESLYINNKKKEKLRLEYVASTRAKQVMIFESNIIEDNQLFNRIDELYCINELGEYHIESSLPEIEVGNIDNITIKKEIVKKGINEISKELCDLKYKELSPSLLEKKGKQVIPKAKYLRPANNIFGIIFHRIMELYILNHDSEIDDIINRAINENILSISSSKVDMYKKYLKECLLAAVKLYQDNQLLDVYNIQKPEYKFCDYDEKLYGDYPTLMTGSIDLLLKNDSEVLIVDYKTDANHYDTNDDFENVLKEKYGEQLNTYKKVISKLSSKSILQIKTKIVWFEEKENETIAHFVEIV